MTAHVNDLIHVLDHRGACLFAGPASETRPERFVLDHRTNDVFADLRHIRVILATPTTSLFNHLVLMPVEIVPQIEKQLARSQGLLGGGGGAIRGAATTFGATEHIEHLFPREVINVRVPKREAFSRSCFDSCPLGSSLEKKMFGIAVIIWKCFDGGSRSRKTRTMRLCTHQATSLA